MLQHCKEENGESKGWVIVCYMCHKDNVTEGQSYYYDINCKFACSYFTDVMDVLGPCKACCFGKKVMGKDCILCTCVSCTQLKSSLHLIHCSTDHLTLMKWWKTIIKLQVMESHQSWFQLWSDYKASQWVWFSEGKPANWLRESFSWQPWLLTGEILMKMSLSRVYIAKKKKKKKKPTVKSVKTSEALIFRLLRQVVWFYKVI